MRRQQTRAPSPTPTTFSGISNYRTDSYKPIREKSIPTVPTIDYRLISRTHYVELRHYLTAYLAKAPPNSRATARQKLTRLTIQQFHELSTDVYDELMRRKTDKEVPFLPVREEFHPKRNQARQKLATLPTSRFEDLSSDVYYELSRRYPEFKEDPSGRISSNSTYDDLPAPDFPATSTARLPISRTADRPADSAYAPIFAHRKTPEDHRKRSEGDLSLSSGRRSEENTRRQDDYELDARSDPPPVPARRRPSQNISRKSEDRERDITRRPGASGSMSGASDITSSANPSSQSATATSAVIIPTKSTIEEEYIETPFGRESGSTTLDDRDRSESVNKDAHNREDDAVVLRNHAGLSSTSPGDELGGLSARLKTVDADVDDSIALSAGNRSGDEFYDKYGRSSVNSDRSVGGNAALASRHSVGRTSVTDDQEKLRWDYEFRIATMQTQITNLQRAASDMTEKERKLVDAEAKVRQMEEELLGLRRRTEEQSSAMRALQKELEELRETRQQERERDITRHQEDERVLHDLREKYEAQLNFQKSNTDDAEIVEQLKSDMEGLLTELSDLSRRNDELMVAKDSDMVVFRDLDMQLKDYKRKYEQAKTELRNVKATSQLYSQAPRFDKNEGQLPLSVDGGVLDVHITAFLISIDALLAAGRSNAPTRVLTPMKNVVNSVTDILEDVRAFERRPQSDRAEVDPEALGSLKQRAEATLSNLVVASKTHATSSGMSPVSLLDAAASHVSLTITEVGRTLCIRRATKAEQEQFAQTTYVSPMSATNGLSPSLRPAEARGSHERKGSQDSSVSSRGRFSNPPNTPPPQMLVAADAKQWPLSVHSSSEPTGSPLHLFGQNAYKVGAVSDESTPADGSEDAWAELKPYLEAQTESIVYAIQSVLSGVRSPTPSPTLNENLTQIITIVSSIVAVCKDNLPPTTASQGNETLRELSEHANKLSQVQELPDVTKESRQVMAKSSFAIANAMKGLMKL